MVWTTPHTFMATQLSTHTVKSLEYTMIKNPTVSKLKLSIYVVQWIDGLGNKVVDPYLLI
jgi:hypothetical protein